MPAYFNILIAFGVYPVAFSLLYLLNKKITFSVETERKLLHVLVGLCLLPIPWLIHKIWVAALIYSVIILGQFLIPIFSWSSRWLGRVLTVERKSIGGATFGIGLFLLFLLTIHNKAFYAICASIVIFADAAAALIGTKYPKFHYKIWRSYKTLTGSLAFIIVAFISTFILIDVFFSVTFLHALFASLLISIISAIIEAFSAYGLDNLFIPLLTYLSLKLLF